jgi:hypothetical protein
MGQFLRILSFYEYHLTKIYGIYALRGLFYPSFNCVNPSCKSETALSQGCKAEGADIWIGRLLKN